MKNAYALAIVVGRRPPVSSHLGDRAIVYADGRMAGFIGGSCSREIVRKAALDALQTGEPRLVSIDPLSCASEGAIDVYIEPELPQPYFFVAGFTPAAHALTKIAPKLDFNVVHFVRRDEIPELEPHAGALITDIEGIEQHLQAVDADVRKTSVAIAATQGHYDEDALAAFVRSGVGFIGLLASAKRGRNTIELLARQGLPPSEIARIRYPVGLDIGARRPSDVAISIFAEVVAARSARLPETGASVDAEDAIAVDPVCGMTVDIAESANRAQFDGALYYFCSSHCSSAFAAEPETYVRTAAEQV
jgi:xanthine dehydrogenase accessory factor